MAQGNEVAGFLGSLNAGDGKIGVGFQLFLKITRGLTGVTPAPAFPYVNRFICLNEFAMGLR